MKKMGNRHLIFCVLLFILVSCSPAVEVENGITVSPLVGTSPVSPVVTPDLPDSAPGKATVWGTLLVLDPMFGAPQGEGGGLYLVPVEEPLSDSQELVIPDFDMDGVPKAGKLDSTTGEFAFFDVPPGNYQMLVITSVGKFPIRSTETKQWLNSLVIESDQRVDLGRVQFP